MKKVNVREVVEAIKAKLQDGREFSFHDEYFLEHEQGIGYMTVVIEADAPKIIITKKFVYLLVETVKVPAFTTAVYEIYSTI